MPDAARRPRPIVATLRPEDADDAAVARVAGVLAEAFATDPYTVSFLRAGRRRERLVDMFDGQVREVLATSGGAATGVVDLALDPADGTLLGAALWDRPEAPRGTSVPALVASAPRMLRVHGRRALDLTRTRWHCERARPDAPHWYLRDVGTAPAARGRGVARALVERRRRDARAAGVGMYLESSTRANVAVYERLGFLERGRVPTVGVEDLTGMWWEA